MSFAFSARKAVQVAAYFVRNRRLPTTKLELVKLIYLADRLSIQRRRQPITGDKLFALDHGPVVSRIMDLIGDSSFSPQAERGIWSQYLETGPDLIVRTKCDPGDNELSECEIELLHDTLVEFGDLDTATLYRRVHELPEWRNCHVDGTSRMIPLSEIAKAVGCEDDLSDMEESQRFDLELARLQGS